jgi:hypothetical protein
VTGVLGANDEVLSRTAIAKWMQPNVNAIDSY